MMQGWTKRACGWFGRCVHYRDMSACGIWHQWCVHCPKILGSYTNSFIEPQYQNDTPFHQACPFTKVSLIRINCGSEVHAWSSVLLAMLLEMQFPSSSSCGRLYEIWASRWLHSHSPPQCFSVIPQVAVFCWGSLCHLDFPKRFWTFITSNMRAQIWTWSQSSYTEGHAAPGHGTDWEPIDHTIDTFRFRVCHSVFTLLSSMSNSTRFQLHISWPATSTSRRNFVW
jgi:hypothetical protein